MNETIALHVTVTGRVQGVWYRGWTVEQAQIRGLTGWVRNRCDGSVEAVFCGDPTLVAEMVATCRQGPPSAVVLSVDIQDIDDPGLDGFQRRPTV